MNLHSLIKKLKQALFSDFHRLLSAEVFAATDGEIPRKVIGVRIGRRTNGRLAVVLRQAPYDLEPYEVRYRPANPFRVDL